LLGNETVQRQAKIYKLKEENKMKKIAALAITLTMVFTLAAFGRNVTPTPEPSATAPASTPGNSTSSPADSKTEGVPKVYMTASVSPVSLIDVYNALGRKAFGDVAVKITLGEPGSKYYLSPQLIRDFVNSVNGTLVECNTTSGFENRRVNTALHYQVAKDHGFTAIAPVLILDEGGNLTIPVTNGRRLTENTIGAHFDNFDFHIVLSHFKGKAITGFGGAITNMSMGYASPKGKSLIHGVGGIGSRALLEGMAEAAKSVADYAGDNILYINVMNNLSIDCDCRRNPAAPDMHDIGILASFDPVALDQACVDLIYQAEDGASLVRRIESVNGIHALKYAESIGFGSRQYELVKLD
jgi:uncharacterized Fe-S center protein